MFSLLLSRIGGYLAATCGLLLAVLAAIGMAKRAGKKEEQQEQKDKAFDQRKEASAIDDKVHGLGNDDLASRLRRDQRD